MANRGVHVVWFKRDLRTRDHAPWLAPPMEAALGGWDAEAYPVPMLDLTEAARAARERIWAFRKRADVKEEGRRILAKHVVPAQAQTKGRMREL